MARIRKIDIKNFRSIKEFSWLPSSGVNCLIGPGDSGKSSILDAIDVCLGAKRNAQFSDADFYRLDVATPISISVTIGELDDALKSIDSYGIYLRGFDASSGEIDEEPESDAETVLTVQLTVGSDLEPSWTLVSERAVAQSQTRNLNWGDRVRLAPTWVGAMADYHLSWRRGSVLNRMSEECADTSAALAKAARDARAAFGEEAQDQLAETLAIVTTTAKELGIPVGENVKAMLDARSVSFSGGTISLHDESGVPLRGLGIGSTRLLIAGLQRKAAEQATVILIDELEHGLEPHRIIRLLSSLGAKEKKPPLQVFMTTHSPVALRELSGDQLFVVKRLEDHHEARVVGVEDNIQGTIRLYPDAFLAPSVIVCEGASEVGLMRGLDQFRMNQEKPSIAAQGVALVDGTGSPLFRHAAAFQALGYRVAVLCDDDAHPTPELEKAFLEGGGKVITWRDGRALEDELFHSLSDHAVQALIALAVELKGRSLINDQIKSASDGKCDLAACQGTLTPETRAVIGKASKGKQSGWFKSVGAMETAARDIIGPDLKTAEAGFRALIEDAFEWTDNAGG